MQTIDTSRITESAPRYTSYPTAPHFHSGVGAGDVADWIGALPEGEAISLYLHVPFCDRLCWFCACHTRQTRRYEPVAEFLGALRAEMALVGRLVAGRAPVGAVHFGGGSPTMLRPDDMIALAQALRTNFHLAPDASVSVEIDPNDMDEARLDALAAIGLTRASLGIQDFDPKVQRAINREQSFEITRDVVVGLRARGIASVNLDLLYGLPHQTTESVASTVGQALEMAPDRIALFGYAHVPWFKKHQTMIDENRLPGPEERLRQAQVAARLIGEAGYRTIGLDHFALPDDGLARAAEAGRLRRNFQGYTDDPCRTLIGLGPSSISSFGQGYAQNVAATGEYMRAVREGRLATQRGFRLSADDLARGWTIERLMCDLGFSGDELAERHGGRAAPILAEAARMARPGPAHWLDRAGDRFVVREAARPLLRLVAARFDAYLDTGQARHSAAV